MSRYFLDTEFHEYKKQPKLLGLNVGKPIDTIELISIGIVSEEIGESPVSMTDERREELINSGKWVKYQKQLEYYAICKEFDIKAAWNNEWLRENVLKSIYKELKEKDKDFWPLFINEENEFVGKRFYKEFRRLINKHGKTRKQIAEEIIEFALDNRKDNVIPLKEKESFGHKPEFYAYYADYDWVCLCQLWSSLYPVKPESFETGMSYMNPKGFPYYCRDLKQLVDEYVQKFADKSGKPFEAVLEDFHNGAPKQTNNHNALADALFNKKLYYFLQNS